MTWRFQGAGHLLVWTTVMGPALGCGGVHRAATLADIASDHVDPRRGRVRLLWLEREVDDGRTDRPPRIVAVHRVDRLEGDSYPWPVYDFSTYTIAGSGASLDVQLSLEGESWSPPLRFSEAGDTFLLCQTEFSGSATCRSYALAHVAGDQSRQIPIEQPAVTLARLMAAGQHSDPSRTWIGPSPWGGSLRFAFAIWEPGESNNMPSGGEIEGTMRVRRAADGRPEALVVDSWTRTPGSVSEYPQAGSPDQRP